MIHFRHVSDFPLFSKKIQTLWKIVNILPFPEKFLDFHPSKFLMTLFIFSHWPQISNFLPIFLVSVSVHFPPVSRKLLFPSLLWKMSPLFYKNSPAFYILYVNFVSPCFDHDAFMHYPMHVLDAPVQQRMSRMTIIKLVGHFPLRRLYPTNWCKSVSYGFIRL